MNRDFKVKVETEEEFFVDLSARNDEFDSLIAEARRQGEEVGLKQSDITASEYRCNPCLSVD